MNKFKSYLSGGIAPISKARKPKAYRLWATIASFGLALISTLVAAQAERQVPFRFNLVPASDATIRQTAHAYSGKERDFVPPIVFQAAGPNVASIQSSVDAFRAALGNPNNLNAPGPLASGRREINWDGGGANDTTTAPVTPFNVFLNTRGGQFTTPGAGLSQAPPSGGPQGGLAGLFNNPTYGTIFSAFSPLRLFTPVGSNITNAFFFLPGSNGTVRATVSGFGAVFTDVDQPDGIGRGKKHGDDDDDDDDDEDRRSEYRLTASNKDANDEGSTLMEFFDADGKRLFSGFVPASPGDRSLSFLGIILDDARIARVRISTGNKAPGPNDERKQDIVMMDDFIYGEPQTLR